uniref:Uncharacterized protein n=1 Tax=Kalanchoe fedtschenkoi TaxID=63787 RepID=A0A7N0UQG3_KALFE
MASMAMTPGFPSIRPRSGACVVVRSPWSSRVFVPITPRHCFHASANDEASSAYKKATDAAKKGVEAAQKAGKDVKDKAEATTGDVSGKAKEAAGKCRRPHKT